MPTHDQYDKDILKQLTRIANNLDKIERRMVNNIFNMNSIVKGANIQRSDTDFGIKLGVNVTNCKDCPYYNESHDSWKKVAEYCDNDVIATEAAFTHLKGEGRG